LSKFLIGTVEVAHHVIPFLQFSWDDRNIVMRYNWDQDHPSPLGKRVYEAFDPSSETFGTDVFMNHTNLNVPDSPCFTGDCVCCYEYIISVCKYLCDMSCAFSHQYECNGPGVNNDHINKFNNYCSSRESKEFFSCAYKFQQRAVLDWNPSANCVTLSLNMELVGIHEDSAAGAGSVVLDMLLKFGAIKYVDEGTWQLEENAKLHQLYSYGDQKSNENCTAFVSTLSHLPITFEE
jgi:hypothetical protein